jgi:hypothetical protein
MILVHRSVLIAVVAATATAADAPNAPPFVRPNIVFIVAE